MRFRFPMAAVLMLVSCAVRAGAPTIPVRFGKTVLNVELARTDAEREQGLMFRRDLGPDTGMLFVFERPEEASFWMKNTPLPLSIAFLDPNKVVLNVDEMAPFDDQHFHRSHGKALYAVEANRNWFESKGIKAGDKAEFELP